jgi:NAD+ synthase (glutamine-hydrolysing)
MRIALCQINTTVGDLQANRRRLEEAAGEAAGRGADLAVFPELTIAGYPPEDLLLRARFLEDCRRALLDPVPELPLPCLAGLPWTDPENGALYNAAVLLQDGRAAAVYRKQLLPNYGVFDEKRYFASGAEGLLLTAGDHRLGVIVCEDAWEVDGPVLDEAAAGAQTILCLSASPFHRRKAAVREETFARLCTTYGVRFLYCNLVGGQDELVFDGGSFCLEPDGAVRARAPEFREAVLCIDLPAPDTAPAPAREPRTPVRSVALTGPPRQRPALPAPATGKLDPLAEIYECLCLGVRDYVRKNGFRRAVLGLSGGIDSGLAACVAVDALGAENVTCVTMPSRYSSAGTRGDAAALAENLGVEFRTLPIEEPFGAFESVLAPHFAGREPDATEENLQARIRAVYLMALSNKFGWLVLNTSNKSESAVGYTTIYGDMIGAYSVLKDVFKTTVFRLARHVNERAGREVIPESMITRPPTAELREEQKDSDALPPYERLDPVLEAYIERDLGVDEMIDAGFDPAIVKQAVRMTDAAEWKRRQAVPGPRVTPKAFGKDRRLPITNRYRP